MPYHITGLGSDGPLEYLKDELSEAAYLAKKMTDNGVENVRVLDHRGQEVDISSAPLPPGWRRGPFKRADFSQ